MTTTLLASLSIQLAAVVWVLWGIRRAPQLLGRWLFALGLVFLIVPQGVFFWVWLLGGQPPLQTRLQEAFLSLASAAVLWLGVGLTGWFTVRCLEGRENHETQLPVPGKDYRHLAVVLDYLPVGVAVEAEEGLVYVNRAFARMLGGKKAAFLGQRFDQCVHEEDRERLQDSWRSSSGSIGRLEVRMRREDGSHVWASVRWLAEFWQGKPSGFWVVADLTGEKEKQADQAATEALFSQGPVVLIRWWPAPKRNVVFVSENIRAWGFDPQRLLNDPNWLYEVIHPEDRTRAEEETQSHIAAGARSWSQQYRLVCPDGKTRWIFERTAAVPDQAGKVVAFDKYLLDVTEFVEASQALDEERARFAAALEATGDVVYDWNIKNGSIAWSRNVLKLFGYSQEEMGGIEAWEERIHPEDRERVLRELAKCLNKGDCQQGRICPQTEYRFRRKDGSYADMFDRCVVYRDAQGQPQRRIGTMGDLSELKRLERQLAATQRLEALGQLAGGLAHDLNNVFTVILGSVDFGFKKLPGDHPAAADLEAIKRASQRAADMVRNVLAFARRQVLDPVPLDLNAQISESLSLLRRLLPETITVDFIPGRNLGTVMVDPTQLQQVLFNLVVNSRDAMPEGGYITIETENVLINGQYVAQHPWAKEGRYVLLSLTDTGLGMDEAIRQHAFEPFFTTKEPGQGTGLGLATVYGIVKQHDGMVHLYSEVGKGTTVKIYLPITERHAVDVGTKVEGPVRGGTETILLVEDEEVVRDVLAESLRTLGYRVFTAGDGVEALALLEGENFAVDLVISDVVMPRLGGWELYQRLHEKAPQMRFLFSTGYSENAVHVNFVKREGVFLLTKPYGLDTLARKVREILDLPKSC